MAVQVAAHARTDACHLDGRPCAEEGLGLGRMTEGNVVTRSLKRIVAGYKSLPGIVVRAIVATLLGDLVSDLYTTVNLFSLSHLGPAYAMVAMICASMAVQVLTDQCAAPGVCR